MPHNTDLHSMLTGQPKTPIRSYRGNHFNPMTYSRLNLPHFMLTNIRSLRYKVDELSAVIESNEVEVCCVTETWLHGGIPTESINLAGFSCHRRDHSNEQIGGGVTGYVQNNWPCERLCSLEQDDLVATSTWIRDASSRVPYFTWRGLPSARSKQSTNDWSHYRMHRQGHSISSIC